MTDNVIGFRSVSQELNASTVELLEKWLEAAKNGEITTVALVGLTSETVLRIQLSEYEDSLRLIAGASILHKLLVDELDL